MRRLRAQRDRRSRSEGACRRAARRAELTFRRIPSRCTARRRVTRVTSNAAGSRGDRNLLPAPYMFRNVNMIHSHVEATKQSEDKDPRSYGNVAHKNRGLHLFPSHFPSPKSSHSQNSSTEMI
ncbi:hypothetical protein NDU88_001456 [Pleurodeles waltl]|uniref:Uncharacterized protein n=1 Tax=Pleurodeles waltl TaxID=8319 RepID=A0AAV7M5D3_PLEWA|nr:hypothetical protein NDU88_001456 [Pleurodeles waltl]